jgi:hypothetical protein
MFECNNVMIEEVQPLSNKNGLSIADDKNLKDSFLSAHEAHPPLLGYTR